MKLKLFSALVGAALVTAIAPAHDAAASPAVVFAKPKAKKAKAPSASDKPPMMKKRIGLSPKGVAWGISVEQLAKIYDRVFDKEFVPLYKKVSPGPRMAALDAELENKKAVLRHNKILFGTLPTGIDQTPLKGIQYSYGNNESMTRVTLRSGTTRNFFFFNDKLWMIYDEHKLREGGPYGASFEEAVQILTKRLGGVEPQMVEPDYAKGVSFPEARWQDGKVVVRAINREYQKIIGMAYADTSVFFNLSKYRKNKVEDPSAMDKDVAAVTQKKTEPPKDEGKDKKKKK
ncbi:MAG: hypothetical protein KC776_42830 [Myxococcales bacterium]|nr:hypothetical protein [Myxococcales bacterium]MCB9577510.1 hypothetical protein [Polyangiaceae bacterium]